MMRKLALCLFMVFIAGLTFSYPYPSSDGTLSYERGLVYEYNATKNVWTSQNYFLDLNLHDYNSRYTGSLNADGNVTASYFCINGGACTNSWASGSTGPDTNTVTAGWTNNVGWWLLPQNLNGNDLNNVRRIGIGTGFNPGSAIEIRGNNDNETNIYQLRYSNDTNPARLAQQKARGTTAAPLGILEGDNIGTWQGWGYNGSWWTLIGGMLMTADQNWAVSNTGSQISFSVTPNDTNIPITPMVLNNDGNLQLLKYAIAKDFCLDDNSKCLSNGLMADANIDLPDYNILGSYLFSHSGYICNDVNCYLLSDLNAGGGSGTPAGNDTEIQYNDAGSFGASGKFTWDNSKGRLLVNNRLSIEASYDFNLSSAPLVYNAQDYDTDFDSGNPTTAYVLIDKASTDIQPAYQNEFVKVAANGIDNYGVALISIPDIGFFVTMYFKDQEFADIDDFNTWFNGIAGGITCYTDYYRESMWLAAGDDQNYIWSNPDGLSIVFGFQDPPTFNYEPETRGFFDVDGSNGELNSEVRSYFWNDLCTGQHGNNYCFPTGGGAPGQVITSDGAGASTWENAVGGGNISGSGTQNAIAIFDNPTTIRGDYNFSFNGIDLQLRKYDLGAYDPNGIPRMTIIRDKGTDVNPIQIDNADMIGQYSIGVLNSYGNSWVTAGIDAMAMQDFSDWHHGTKLRFWATDTNEVFWKSYMNIFDGLVSIGENYNGDNRGRTVTLDVSRGLMVQNNTTSSNPQIILGNTGGNNNIGRIKGFDSADYSLPMRNSLEVLGYNNLILQANSNDTDSNLMLVNRDIRLSLTADGNFDFRNNNLNNVNCISFSDGWQCGKASGASGFENPATEDLNMNDYDIDSVTHIYGSGTNDLVIATPPINYNDTTGDLILQTGDVSSPGAGNTGNIILHPGLYGMMASPGCVDVKYGGSAGIDCYDPFAALQYDTPLHVTDEGVYTPLALRVGTKTADEGSAYTFDVNGNTALNDTLFIDTKGIVKVNNINGNINFYIDSDGNTGIRTDSPVGYLDVRNNTGQRAMLLTDGRLEIQNRSEAPALMNSIVLADGQNNWMYTTLGMTGDAGINKGDFTISTRIGGDSTNEWERLRIQRESGNVGINETNPQYLLDVNGNVDANQYCINGDCTSSWSSGYWALNGTDIYKTNTGGVAIGRISTNALLDINGMNRNEIRVRDQNTEQSSSVTYDVNSKTIFQTGGVGYEFLAPNLAGKGYIFSTNDSNGIAIISSGTHVDSNIDVYNGGIYDQNRYLRLTNDGNLGYGKQISRVPREIYLTRTQDSAAGRDEFVYINNYVAPTTATTSVTPGLMSYTTLDPQGVNMNGEHSGMESWLETKNNDSEFINNAYTMYSRGVHTGNGTVNNFWGYAAEIYNNSSGRITNAAGLFFRAINYSTGSIGNAYGVRMQVLNMGAGNIDNAYGGFFDVDKVSTGYITNATGGYVADMPRIDVSGQTRTGFKIAGFDDTLHGGLTDVNQFGLFIGDVRDANIPDAYALYSAGGKVYFKDDVNANRFCFNDGNGCLISPDMNGVDVNIANLVPYTGAVKDVDLGNHKLTVGNDVNISDGNLYVNKDVNIQGLLIGGSNFISKNSRYSGDIGKNNFLFGNNDRIVSGNDTNNIIILGTNNYAIGTSDRLTIIGNDFGLADKNLIAIGSGGFNCDSNHICMGWGESKKGSNTPQLEIGYDVDLNYHRTTVYENFNVMSTKGSGTGQVFGVETGNWFYPEDTIILGSNGHSTYNIIPRINAPSIGSSKTLNFVVANSGTQTIDINGAVDIFRGSLNVGGNTSITGYVKVDGNVYIDNNLFVKGQIKTNAGIQDGLGWDMGQQRHDNLRFAYSSGGWTSSSPNENIIMDINHTQTFNSYSVHPSDISYSGGAFDGRFLYFAPLGEPGTNYRVHGQVLRYDTINQTDFTDPNNWKDFNAQTVDKNASGFYGTVFDGNYMYFIPFWGKKGNGDTSSAFIHGTVLRYNTRGSFDNNDSWTTMDLFNVDKNGMGFYGGTFDGKYLYLIPNTINDDGAWIDSGTFFRYNTTLPFTSKNSWEKFESLIQADKDNHAFNAGVYDGKYMYFVSGNATGTILRYDTEADFNVAGSWVSYNLTGINADYHSWNGVTFDGRYVYIPQSNPNASTSYIARYDTTRTFNSWTSWTFYDSVAKIPSIMAYDSISFDGKYIYAIPYNDGSFAGTLLRYDTSLPFTEDASYDTIDLSTEVGNGLAGFNGAVFDGEYLYLIPHYSGGPDGLFARIKAYSGGLAHVSSISELAKGSDFYMTPTGQVLIGTTARSVSDSKLEILQDNDATGLVVKVNATQANVTAADTFVDFRSTSGSEGSIAGTAVSGVIAYNTFTGSHYTQIDDKTDLEPGMLLEAIDGAVDFKEVTKTKTKTHTVDMPVAGTGKDANSSKGFVEAETVKVEKTVTETSTDKASNKVQLFKSKKSDTRLSKAVIGVYGGTDQLGRDLALSSGTAIMCVANEGKDLQIGDYLVSSNTPGCAEKQEDDIFRNTTVAKATESVSWKEEKTKYIRVLLLNG